MGIIRRSDDASDGTMRGGNDLMGGAGLQHLCVNLRMIRCETCDGLMYPDG